MYNNTILALLMNFHIFVDFVHILCKPGIFDFPWFFLLERISLHSAQKSEKDFNFGKVELFFWKAKFNFLQIYVLLHMYYFGIFWNFKSNLYRELYCICGETGRRFWAPVDRLKIGCSPESLIFHLDQCFSHCKWSKYQYKPKL